MTDEDIAKAKRLRRTGLTYKQIGTILGRHMTVVRRWIDEGVREKERQTAHNRRHHRDRYTGKNRIIDGPPLSDILQRLAEIPADTRTLTQRLMGDPLPGRGCQPGI